MTNMNGDFITIISVLFLVAFLAGILFAVFGFKVSYGSFFPLVRIAQFRKDPEDSEWRKVFVKVMKRARTKVSLTAITFYSSKYEEIQEAIKKAVKRNVEIVIYYPPKKMKHEKVNFLRSLGCTLKLFHSTRSNQRERGITS